MTDEQNALVESNLKLAGWVAKKFRIPGYEYQDMFQLACLGLCKAAIRNQEGKKASFTTWAVMNMRKEILRELAHARYKLKTQSTERTLEHKMANNADVSESLQAEDLAREICRFDTTTLEIVIRRLQGMNHAQVANDLFITQKEVCRALYDLQRAVDYRKVRRLVG